MNNNQSVSREYFENLSADYVRLIVESQAHIYRNINPVLTRRVSGRVLTIGSGSVMNFAATHASQVVCLDLSENMLRQLNPPEKVVRVCADAQFLPFEPVCFDFVVVPFIIHHLAQDSIPETDLAVSLMFKEASRMLRRNGRIIVTDLFIPAMLEAFERSLYGPAVKMLNRRMKPMMYFYSVDRLRELLHDAGLRIDFDQKVQIKEKIMPTLLLPKFKVPASYHPARFHIIEVTNNI